jgi:hypothetical protein
MRSNLPAHRHQPPPRHDDRDRDLGGRVEVRTDHHAAPGDYIPSLARLLRQMRDRRRLLEQDADTAAGTNQK